MLAPTAPTRYRCPCGDVVLVAAGPSWVAWDLAAVRAAEHARTCGAARGRWDVETRDDGRARNPSAED